MKDHSLKNIKFPFFSIEELAFTVLQDEWQCLNVEKQNLYRNTRLLNKNFIIESTN